MLSTRNFHIVRLFHVGQNCNTIWRELPTLTKIKHIRVRHYDRLPITYNLHDVEYIHAKLQILLVKMIKLYNYEMLDTLLILCMNNVQFILHNRNQIFFIHLLYIFLYLQFLCLSLSLSFSLSLSLSLEIFKLKMISLLKVTQ